MLVADSGWRFDISGPLSHWVFWVGMLVILGLFGVLVFLRKHRPPNHAEVAPMADQRPDEIAEQLRALNRNLMGTGLILFGILVCFVDALFK